MKISIIGGGVMGSAIAAALLKKEIISPNELTISDLDKNKLSSFAEKGVNITNDNLEAVGKTDVILIAVKPQMFNGVLAPLKAKIEASSLIISIAAGVTIQTIQELLNHKPVVRVMPNTPALISEGMSGWFADVSVSADQKQQVKTILQSIGAEAELQNEDQIDSITALSGSGPAYVFLFIKGLIEGGIELGLSEETAKIAAIQTVLGGSKLAFNSDQDLQKLIENVTSKGGTTAAAREKFAELNFKNNITKAMQAAYNRAKKLAKK